MIEIVAAWPLSAWLAVLSAMGAALAWPANKLWLFFTKRSERFERREEVATELVEILRCALDKGRIRENGLASACDILTMAIESLECPRPAMIEAARLRAIEHLKAAREACLQIERAAR